MATQEDKNALVEALSGNTKPRVRSMGGSVGVPQIEDWWCRHYKVHILDPNERLVQFEKTMLELLREGRVRYGSGTAPAATGYQKCSPDSSQGAETRSIDSPLTTRGKGACSDVLPDRAGEGVGPWLMWPN